MKWNKFNWDDIDRSKEYLFYADKILSGKQMVVGKMCDLSHPKDTDMHLIDRSGVIIGGVSHYMQLPEVPEEE